MVHLVMTPESINMLAAMSEGICRSLGVTISITTHGSTKLSIRPSAYVNRNISLRLFGNGSMQFCGSPIDIEVLYSAAKAIVRSVVDRDLIGFLSSMKQLRSPVI